MSNSSISSQTGEKLYKTAECSTYDYLWWHFIVPPLKTLDYLCVSYDKTAMFLVASIRIIIIMIITKIYYDLIPINGIGSIIFLLLVLYNVLNLLVLSYVITKVQKNFKHN